MQDLETLQQLLRADKEIDPENLDRRRREMIGIDVGIDTPWGWAKQAIREAWGVDIDDGPNSVYIDAARFEDANYKNIGDVHRCFPPRPKPAPLLPKRRK